jgi:hypothetical protein
MKNRLVGIMRWKRGYLDVKTIHNKGGIGALDMFQRQAVCTTLEDAEVRVSKRTLSTLEKVRTVTQRRILYRIAPEL